MKKEGVCSIEAEVFGTGVKMWLLSQGGKVKVTRRKHWSGDETGN